MATSVAIRFCPSGPLGWGPRGFTRRHCCSNVCVATLKPCRSILLMYGAQKAMGRGIEIQGCVSSRPRGSGSLPPPQSTEPTYVRVPRQVPTYPPHIRPNYCYWRKDCLGSHSTRCPLALDGDRAMSPLTRSVLTDVAISTWDTSYGHLAPRCQVAPSNVVCFLMP